MSDLTERAIDVARGRLRSEYGGSAVEVTIAALDAAGMLTDPDAEDPRITAAWGLVQAWDRQARRVLEHKAALEHRPWTESRHAALHAEVCAAVDHADALRLVLDGDPDTTGDDE